MNGKREDFTLTDFDDYARTVSINARRARAIVQEVRDAVAGWPAFADTAQVGEKWREAVDPSLRIDLPA